MLTHLENDKGGAWIDISVPLYTGMVHWPDNPPVLIERMQDILHGDAANVSKLELGAILVHIWMHPGTSLRMA
jgi:kynurenine formamidase